MSAVADLTPRLRRITLTGPQLSSFSLDDSAGGRGSGDLVELPAFESPGFDDHVKCIFSSDRGRAALPRQLPHGIEWTPSDDRVTRDYTPTRVDLDAQELDLEFVLHGHGPAASWAREAVIGSRLHIVGPKLTTALPADLEWIVLAGDETAIPAITRFMRERPVRARALITIVISDASAQVPIDAGDGDIVRWIVGDPTDGPALRDAVAEILPASGSGYAWAAGESRALLPLRRLFKASECLDKSRINVTGYWTWTAAGDNAAAHASRDESPQPVIPVDAQKTLPPSPVPWLAVRAALSVGVFNAFGDGPMPVAELARRTSSDRDALQLLLDALVAENILRRAETSGAGSDSGAGAVYALDVLGETLLDDEHAAEHFLGHHADEALALLNLGESLRRDHGTTAWGYQYGQTLYESAVADPEVFEELTEGAIGLAFFSAAIAADESVTGAKQTLVTGPGATACAEVLARTLGADSVSVAEQPEFLGVLRDVAADPEALSFVPFEELPASAAETTIVSALALGMRTDDEAREYLAALHAHGDQLVLVERFSQDSLNPLAHESALTDYGKTGRAATDSVTFDALGAPHWHKQREFELGWGMRAIVYTASR